MNKTMAKKQENPPDVAGELIRQLLRENGDPKALFDKGGLLDQLKAADRNGARRRAGRASRLSETSTN